MLAMINPKTNHCVEVMKTTVQEGKYQVDKFLVRVIKQAKEGYFEITAFSDEWEYLYEVEQYLVDGGYMQIFP